MYIFIIYRLVYLVQKLDERMKKNDRHTLITKRGNGSASLDTFIKQNMNNDINNSLVIFQK